MYILSHTEDLSDGPEMYILSHKKTSVRRPRNVHTITYRRRLSDGLEMYILSNIEDFCQTVLKCTYFHIQKTSVRRPRNVHTFTYRRLLNSDGPEIYIFHIQKNSNVWQMALSDGLEIYILSYTKESQCLTDGVVSWRRHVHTFTYRPSMSDMT
jgi:hypothetical protein